MITYNIPKEIAIYKKKIHELVTSVDEMRRLQKQFFKHRGKDTLTWAKKKEKEVDALIKLHHEPQIF